MKRIVLASASPRRKEIFKKLGFKFDVVASNFDEGSIDEKDPMEFVRKEALGKAREVASREGGIIIGYDVIGYVDGEILCKPKDLGDAKRMIALQRNKKTHVYCGIAMIDTEAQEELTDVAHTIVKFRDLNEKEIEGYVSNEAPLDYSAAYCIGEGGCRLIEGIEGCFFSVMGVPVSKTLDMLRMLGVDA